MKIKGFDKNLRCRGFQFEIGKEYKIDSKKLELCSDKVFHYCDTLRNVHDFYPVTSNNRYCEIEVLGEEIHDNNYKKFGSNHIKIVREITGEELDYLKGLHSGNTGLFNTGNRNTGYYNTGDSNTGDSNTGNRNTGNYNTGNYNTGYYNTGNYNTGDSNTGDYNTGNYNTGYYNTGNYNTGYYNTGDSNTGDYNTGDFNIGDYNTGDYNTGCFNTKNSKIKMFNKDSDITYMDWLNSEARSIMDRICFETVEWIAASGMTEEEKKKYPSYKTTGGYLRKRDTSECYKEWWEDLTDEEKDIIKDIPNFDVDIFKEITGIDVEQ